MWKDFFYFSHRERQAIFVLIVFIGGVFLGKFIFSPAKHQPEELSKWTESDSIPQTLPSNKEDSYVPLYHSQQQGKRQHENHKTYQTNIQENKTYFDKNGKNAEHPHPEMYPKAEKFSQGTVIELNSADSSDLKKIPGIGSSFAKRIIAYRNLLGGYHRIEQLKEVYGMYEELYGKITSYLKIDPQLVTLIQVNNISLDKLKAHPYFNFYQAKAIVEIRKKKGRINGIEDLKLLEEFSTDDWVRITPYLTFQ
jgi:competence ComEA-like helix-hairpin-helix protein